MTSQVADRAGPRHAFLSGVAPVDQPDEPAWLSNARRSATGWLSQHGLPTRKDEDWRYFDLEPILGLAFTPPGEPGIETSAADVDALAGPGLGGSRLVLLNGRFCPALSQLSSHPAAGSRMASLAEEIHGGSSALAQRWTGGGYTHAFEALNASLAADGTYIELAPDTVHDTPIEIVYLTVAAGDLPLVSPRSVIYAHTESSATIVETYLSVGDGPSLTNSHTRVILAPGAHIDHYRIQAEGPDAFHLSTVEVQAGDASHFASRTLAVGALKGRHEVRAHLAHPKAEVRLDGLYLTTGGQCHDHPVLVDHAAPACTSRQLYKGIVSGAGHGIFNGHVIVRPAAVGTDAHQTNKNLLLSDRAEVDTRPRLEIFTDDVSATHGAAVGQLEPDALFYLRSRGIPDRDARAMLVAGFAADVLERFTPGPVRRRADQLVAGHLGAGTGTDRPGFRR